MIKNLYFAFLLFTIASQSQTINVATSAQFQSALNSVIAGQTIVLAPGNYLQSGGFNVPSGINGTDGNPIIVQGNPNATISSNSLNNGYGLHLLGNQYWKILDLNVNNSKKGIVLDNSNYNIIENARVTNIGGEAIHLRTFSSYNTIKNCFIDETGLVSTGFGEAIYVGSALSNWCTYTTCNPDASNYNIIDGNSFGNSVVSENIDIKEGTVGGIIKNNHFNGLGLNNQNSGDSWVDIKGNYYLIICNTGINTILDGFQTHINAVGFGNFNTFSDNQMTINSTGNGINIKTSNATGTAYNNIVCNNNTATNAGQGLTNIQTVNCTSSCLNLGLANNPSNSIFKYYPNPFNDATTITSSLELQNATITIFNISGQEIHKIRNINGNIFTINRDNISNGVYFFQISNDSKIIATEKIIIN